MGNIYAGTWPVKHECWFFIGWWNILIGYNSVVDVKEKKKNTVLAKYHETDGAFLVTDGALKGRCSRFVFHFQKVGSSSEKDKEERTQLK